MSQFVSHLKKSSMGSYCLEVVDLSAGYGDQCLFTSLNFSIGPEQIWWVTGCNGIGKSTLLRTLVGLHHPHSGIVSWQGQDIRYNREEYLQSLSYVGHRLGLKPELTIRENLMLSQVMSLANSRMNPLVLREALQYFELEAFINTPVQSLSQGQRQRMAWVRLMLLDKLFWVLDEPLAGLDQTMIARTIDLLRHHAHRGGAVLMTSHQSLSNLVSHHLAL